LYTREHSQPPETWPGQVSGNNKRRIEENDHTEELFSLEEKLINDNQVKANTNVNELVLEIVKCRGSEVLDIRFLRKKQKYYHINEHGRFCLAENKGSQKCYFFFHDQLQGRIRFSDKTSHDIAELCTEENLYHKKKKVYRCQLPAGGLVFVNDGIQRFYLQVTTPVQSPYIPEPVPKKKSLFKSLLHLGLLLFIILPLIEFCLLPQNPHRAPLANDSHISQTVIHQRDRHQTKKVKGLQPSESQITIKNKI